MNTSTLLNILLAAFSGNILGQLVGNYLLNLYTKRSKPMPFLSDNNVWRIDEKGNLKVREK